MSMRRRHNGQLARAACAWRGCVRRGSRPRNGGSGVAIHGDATLYAIITITPPPCTIDAALRKETEEGLGARVLADFYGQCEAFDKRGGKTGATGAGFEAVKTSFAYDYVDHVTGKKVRQAMTSVGWMGGQIGSNHLGLLSSPSFRLFPALLAGNT